MLLLSMADPFLGGGAPGRLAGPGSSLATKIGTSPQKLSCRIGVDLRCLGALAHWDSEACATKSSRGFIPTRYEIVC